MENKTTEPTLPEELVRAHGDLIDQWAVAVLPFEHATLTLDYMGRFAEWVETEGWAKYHRGWSKAKLSTHRISTPQLIDLYFQSTNK
jgi:hypothetical protein